MTYETLKREVAALGFEDAPENEDFLLFALRRAQRVISIDFPLVGTYRAYQKLPCPILKIATPKAALSLKAGAAVSFRYLAPLKLMLSEGGTERSVSLPDGEGEYRLLCRADSTLRFEGTGYAWDLAVYRNDTIDSVEKIPVCAPFVRYELGTLVPDFIAASESAKDAEQSPIARSTVDGELLWLPSDFTGEFSLRYTRRPRPIEKEDERVDVAPEAEPLLALLAGAYLWLDDEPEQAQYYMQLYREGVNRLQSVRRKNLASSYEDVLHWA